MQKSVAKRYAKALFEIAKGKSATPQIGLDHYQGHLEDLEKALCVVKDLRTILVNPAVHIKKRHAIVRKIGQSSNWDRSFVNFVCLLIDRNRLALVPDITEAFKASVDELKGLVRLHLTSARPLRQIEVEQIVNSLKFRTQAPVEVETSVDPDLIGGVIARVGEKVYDASIRTQLQKVRRSILETV